MLRATNKLFWKGPVCFCRRVNTSTKGDSEKLSVLFTKSINNTKPGDFDRFNCVFNFLMPKLLILHTAKTEKPCDSYDVVNRFFGKDQRIRANVASPRRVDG